MKKWRIFFLLVSAAALAAVFYSDNFRAPDVPVYLVYDPGEMKEYGHIVKAYESVLEEEGVLFARVRASLLLTRNASALGAQGRAVIFPDGAAQILPAGLGTWTEEFTGAGGTSVVVYDAGVRGRGGAFLERGLFTDLIGVNMVTYSEHKADLYCYGHFRFRDGKAAKFLQIPSGKLDEENFLSGYTYGRLLYPMARAEALPGLRRTELLAAVYAKNDGKAYPGLVLRGSGKGRVFYANMPLGRDKSFSDDLPLRAFLRTALFKAGRIPHLANTPEAKGGIVVNWHIDSSAEHTGIPWAIKNGYFSRSLKYSIDITAGDFRDRPEDGLGFDACGKGSTLVKELMRYGTIGSHGGWGHNWFAENIVSGKFGKAEIEAEIRRNNECLSSITGYAVREYAAPEGVHTPETTAVLERLGVKGYYYTGDTGSGPNRTFLGSAMVSDKVFAFPVMPFGKEASLYEMKRAGKSLEEVSAWLRSVAEFAERNRTVRLIYSHIYDIENNYPQAVMDLEALLERKQAEGRIKVDTMEYFASFIERLLKTSYTFSFEESGLGFSASNPGHLGEIAVALPAEKYREPEGRNVSRDSDGYFYVALKNTREDSFFAPKR